jgi:hypothetical protein
MNDIVFVYCISQYTDDLLSVFWKNFRIYSDESHAMEMKYYFFFFPFPPIGENLKYSENL